MTMHIEAVLFDADGVIQKRPSAWKGRLGQVLGFSGDPNDFSGNQILAEFGIRAG